MALYKGATFGVAPLRVQVTAPDESPIYVVGYSAAGETAYGATSRPILTRPSSPGEGTGVAVSMSPDAPPAFPSPEGLPASPVSASTVVTRFSKAPSVPVVNVGCYNVPLVIRWEVPLRDAFVVKAGGTVLLYALTNGGHTWNGEVLWEEK